MKNTKRSLVSVVVLSWNTKSDTLRCIEAIKHSSHTNIELIVVDNGSTDGSKEALKKLDDIVFIDLDKNTGFTGGQIAAFERVRGDYIALINSDAVVDRSWITHCLDSFAGDEKIAVVGGRSYEYKSKKDIGDTKLAYYSYQVIDPILGYVDTLRTGDAQGSVNSISGAGVMIRTESLKETGYFDNGFFAYYEETDLFSRLKRAGYKIWYNPKAYIWHKIGQSTKSKPVFMLTQMEKNRYRFAYKNFDLRRVPRLWFDYWAKFIRATARVLFRRADEWQKARYTAGIYNLKMTLNLMRERFRVQRLGGSFEDNLKQDLTHDVTVVIPCYNYADHVAEAIESALNQTLKPTRVIVINDGSTDTSLKVINTFKKNVEIVSQKNQGIIATKNTGLSMVNTKFVLFLDADDVMPNNYIEELVTFQRKERANVVYTDMDLFGAFESHHDAGKFSKYRLRRGNFIHNSALIQTDLMKAVGGYNPKMRGGYEDWELYINLAEHRARFAYSESLPRFRYRQHEAEKSRNVEALRRDIELRERINSIHPGYTTSRSLRELVKNPRELVRVMGGRLRRLPYKPSDIKYLIVQSFSRFDDWLEHRLLPRARFLGKPIGFMRLFFRGDFDAIAKKLRLRK